MFYLFCVSHSCLARFHSFSCMLQRGLVWCAWSYSIVAIACFFTGIATPVRKPPQHQQPQWLSSNMTYFICYFIYIDRPLLYHFLCTLLWPLLCIQYNTCCLTFICFSSLTIHIWLWPAHACVLFLLGNGNAGKQGNRTVFKHTVQARAAHESSGITKNLVRILLIQLQRIWLNARIQYS